jgi:hypothetical protein
MENLKIERINFCEIWSKKFCFKLLLYRDVSCMGLAKMMVPGICVQSLLDRCRLQEQLPLSSYRADVGV